MKIAILSDTHGLLRPAVLEYLKNGINSAMNRYNTKKPKKEKSTKKAAPEGDDAAASEQAEEGKE